MVNISRVTSSILYVHVCMYVCLCVHVHTYVCMYIHIYVRTYVHIYTLYYTDVIIHVHTDTYIYTCIYTYTYVFMYVCTSDVHRMYIHVLRLQNIYSSCLQQRDELILKYFTRNEQ